MLDTSTPTQLVDAELLHYDGQAFYKATDGDGSMLVLPGSDSSLPRLPDTQSLIARAPRLMPDATVGRATILDEYDNYYYTRRPEQGAKTLPVVRIEFADERHTWFHIDPRTGQVLERSTRGNRVYRWLYNGLHSLDIKWLWDRRPLWDIVVITLCLGGLALSVIGVIAGIRRLRLELGFPRARLARARVDVALEPSLESARRTAG